MAIFVSDTEPSLTTTHNHLSKAPDDPAGFAGLASNRGGSSGQPQADDFDVTSPRPVITGAQKALPLINQCLIDWLAFTVKTIDPADVLEILKLDAGLFSELDRGYAGYGKSLRCGNIVIYYQGRAEMGCHCVLSGQGCRLYESQFVDSPWLDLLNAAFTRNASFTRLDLAHDNVDSTLDLEKLKSAIADKSIRTRFKSGSQSHGYDFNRDVDSGDTGKTIYFGKRSSRVYLRFYDKAAQLGLQPFIWNRAEFELKDERAHNTAVLLAAGMPAGRLFAGIMNNYLSIINRDNSDTSRCSLQSWWADWLASTEKIRLTTASQLRTVDEAMEYIRKQYAPTVATIQEYLGAEEFDAFIRTLVKDGQKRMSMRHEMMLFVSSQAKADNYNDDLIEQEERAAIMEHDGGLTKQEAEQAAQQIQDDKGDLV